MYTTKRLNNVETRLITFGDPFRCTSEVIVVITGCPGIPEFYREFADQLHRCTELPVCVVGHAGHDDLRYASAADTNKSLYDIKGQIEHKLDLINNHFDKKKKLHLIGHSIGAWLLMELLHKNDNLTKRISSVNLLFPTLQNFSETKNGKLVNNLIRYLHRIILLFLFIIQLLPSIRLLGIKVYLYLNSLPSYYVERITIYLNPLLQEKSMLLAYESMGRIRQLNIAAIKKVKHMTNVVYSPQDEWVPMHHIQDLKKLGPHFTLKQVNVDHAFVLKSSVLVGKVVSNLILNNGNRSIHN
uniref:Lipid droplet-associated hydrolase n=1 Tax=Heliothis virescens TaxID=7102 RepID=A0A2A4JN28_HELVI